MVPWLRRFHDDFLLVEGVVSYTLQIIVFYLLFYRSKKQFHMYSRILLISSTIDFLLTTVIILLRPQVTVQQGRLYVISGGLLAYLRKPLLTVLAVSILNLHILVVPLQFVFRYFVVCRNHLLTSRKIFATMFALGIVVLLEAVWNVITIRHNEDYWEENSKIVAQNPYFTEDANMFVVISQHNLSSFCHISFVAVIVVTSHLVVIYTTIETLRYLKSARNFMCQHTRQMHDSFTRLLITQASVPLMLLFLPILLLIITVTIFPLELPPECGIIISMTLAVIPLVNPLLIIFIIPHYRRIVLGICFNRSGATQ